jgi:16S rRNA G966 N2-methylase RsmD
MKDRTREAVLNLLGGTFDGAFAFDLFGGSGILAFESISRGASHAIIWEILRPGAATIRQLAEGLGIGQKVTVLATDVLQWTRDWKAKDHDWKELGIAPVPEGGRWVVFCCPPYALWEPLGQELKELMSDWYEAAPTGSLFAVEMEVETPESWLPEGPDWDLRTYAPAKVAIAEKP